MKTLVIYTHPWDKSFNNHILNLTVKKLLDNGDDVDIIDLHADNFDPVMRPEDLKLFSKGEYADKLAEDYVKRLQNSDRVIFIFPIWWYGMPAMLKGFFDKVMLKGTTYTEDSDNNLQGVLNINQSAVFTTANIDKDIFSYLGDPINNTLITGTLKMVGIENTTWIHCPTVHLEDSRNNFIEEINNYLS